MGRKNFENSSQLVEATYLDVISFKNCPEVHAELHVILSLTLTVSGRNNHEMYCITIRAAVAT